MRLLLKTSLCRTWQLSEVVTLLVQRRQFQAPGAPSLAIGKNAVVEAVHRMLKPQKSGQMNIQLSSAPHVSIDFNDIGNAKTR